jgi:hypothetical protein
VHVGIDKGWGEQPAAKINFGLLRGGASGFLIAADVADQTPVGHHGSRAWVVRSVDASPDEDHKLVRSAGLIQI